MEIFTVSNEFIKIYSKGIEKEYKGKSIIYKDLTTVFVFFYFKGYKKGYIIKDDSINGVELPYIEGKVRIIASVEDKSCYYLSKIVNEAEEKYGQVLYCLRDILYLKLFCLVIRRKPKVEDFFLILEG